MNIAGFICFLLFLALRIAVIAIYNTRKIRLNTTAAYFMGNRSLGFWIVILLFLTNTPYRCAHTGKRVRIDKQYDVVNVLGHRFASLAMIIVADFFFLCI